MGQIIFLHSVGSPAQITANQNDYNPGGMFSTVRLSSDAARNITGMVAGVPGEERLLVNVGAFDITVKHQDAASVAANRFLTASGVDIVLAPNGGTALVYDNVTQRWRAF